MELEAEPTGRALSERRVSLEPYGVISTCLRSLYRDRVLPTLQRLQCRMADAGASECLVGAALALCQARDPAEYNVVLSAVDGFFICLREEPAWFDGWVDAE